MSKDQNQDHSNDELVVVAQALRALFQHAVSKLGELVREFEAGADLLNATADPDPVRQSMQHHPAGNYSSTNATLDLGTMPSLGFLPIVLRPLTEIRADERLATIALCPRHRDAVDRLIRDLDAARAALARLNS